MPRRHSARWDMVKSSSPRPPKPSPRAEAERIREDKWNTNPPQVTSYLTCPRAKFLNDRFQVTYTSPNCGFGWRFQFDKSFYYQTSRTEPQVQELVGKVEMTLQPHMCSSMPLSNMKINVRVTYPMDEAKSVQEEEFTDVSIASSHSIGVYTEPPRYKGQTYFEVTLTFSPSDGLSLPTTPSVNTRKALYHSLDGPSFVDTKFYLFSARIQGRPAVPKAVFAKSLLLMDSSAYMHDLLMPENGFANGTPCDLREDVPEETTKLNADAFEYDSDSDLEDGDESCAKGKGKVPEAASSPTIGEENESPMLADTQPRGLQDGRAFAINGTAYKTWKAFIFYTYMNDIHFNALKSQRTTKLPHSDDSMDADVISCSPKSMYRFADYADLPQLKSLAREGIRKSLSKFNIISELFSTFTFKYQDIIELEVEFLVENFTPGVAQDLDEMLRSVVLGTKPYCFRVLAFTMRRLRGDNAEAAWKALGNDTPETGEPHPQRIPSSVPASPVIPPTPTWPQSPNFSGKQPESSRSGPVPVPAVSESSSSIFADLLTSSAAMDTKDTLDDSFKSRRRRKKEVEQFFDMW